MIFERVFAKDEFMKELFEKEAYRCAMNEQHFQFLGSHWVMVYQDKKKIYFIDSPGRDFTHNGFKFKRPVYQVSRRLQCLDSKLCGVYLTCFGCRLARGLDLNSIMDYFTWDCRFNDEFIYSYIKEKLQIVKTIREDSVQRRVQLRSHQGKTVNSENNTRRFRNVVQFTRSVRSIQSSMVDTCENGYFNQRN